jgi:site-specific DNA recombinase
VRANPYGAEGGEHMRPELLPIWQAYTSQAADHVGWSSGAAYLRESTREQADGFSLSAQLKGTLDEAVRRKLWVAQEHVFVDLMSGRREDRTAFQGLLQVARSGLLAAVIVLHTSRWARNAMVSRKYKEELRRRGIEVIAINAPFDVSRPEGKLAERMMEAVDEFGSDTIGDWVRLGLREKHERGEPLGRLPETFYKDQAGQIRPHPELAATVLEGFRRYATGRVGMGELAIWCRKEGLRTPSGRPLTDEWWRATLANPLNAGYVGYRRKRGGRELRKASFTGFVPMDLYREVQEVRHARAREPKQGARYRVYLLTGVARCGVCDSRVTACEQHRMRCRRAAQHSLCDQPSVVAEKLERQIGRWLCEALVLTPQQRVELARLVRARIAKESTGGGAADRAAALRLQLKRLNDVYIFGAMAESEYQSESQTLRTTLARIEQVPDESRVTAAIRLAQDIPALWHRARPERRKQMVQGVFEVVRILHGRIVAVRPRSEVAPLLAVNATSKDWRSRPDSNRRSRP